MYPFVEIFGLKIYMTGLWIIAFLISFIIVAKYLCNKRHQDFWKIFYWLPVAIIIVYCLWSYSHFVLNHGLFPQSIEQIKILLSPYWYQFHFSWLIIGYIIAMFIFFRAIKRNENKRIWIDILFFATILSFIPLGIFLTLGDNFVGKTSNSWIAIKPLTIQSNLNKFGAVYPVGLFLSFLATISALLTLTFKKYKKQFGIWLIWFIIFIIWYNFLLFFQQYPKYGVTSLGWIVFDIKTYISFFTIMLCLNIYYKRNQKQSNLV